MWSCAAAEVSLNLILCHCDHDIHYLKPTPQLIKWSNFSSIRNFSYHEIGAFHGIEWNIHSICGALSSWNVNGLQLKFSSKHDLWLSVLCLICQKLNVLIWKHERVFHLKYAFKAVALHWNYVNVALSFRFSFAKLSLYRNEIGSYACHR